MSSAESWGIIITLSWFSIQEFQEFFYWMFNKLCVYMCELPQDLKKASESLRPRTLYVRFHLMTLGSWLDATKRCCDSVASL